MTTFQRVLVMGATGLVGRELMHILLDREFPAPVIVPVASPASAGMPLVIGERRWTVRGSDPALFQSGDLVFFTGHDDLAAELVPLAVQAGAVVVDNSATFRMDPTVPLVIPEINAEAIKGHAGLIANPNCTTATFILPLAAIRTAYGLEWTTVASYQAISGAGTGAYQAFKLDLAVAPEADYTRLDPTRLACNVIPSVGSFDAEGISSEETKMTLESRKILGDPELDLVGTAVRVPTLVCHACAVHCRTRDLVPDSETLRAVIEAQGGVMVMDDPEHGGYPTPLMVAGTDPVWVGRIRRFDAHTVGFFAVADNLRKGAALNAVQIGELL